WKTGPEYQILNNEVHRDGQNPLTQASACYAIYAPTKDMCKPVGEWNTTKIVCNGHRVEHWLNGEKVVDYELFSDDWERRVADSKFSKFPHYGRMPTGHINLQDHGDPVWYRNIKIRRL
ncbi:MAG: 3-keto-disaccharide hydrolase, partial [Planctomycetota bacterium]